MTFSFSKRSTNALASCHPVLQSLAIRALELSPVDFVVTEGHRGREAQEAAFAAGRSRAHFGESPHNVEPSLALDVVPFPVDWEDAAKFQAIAIAFKRAAVEQGVVLRWGGDFRSLKDMPHFEIDEPRKKSEDKSLEARGDLLKLSERDLLARVVWGECRGVDARESLAIAFVVVNRSKKPGWWGRDVKSVCMAAKQFSCLNQGDPNLPKILAGDFSDGSFANCLAAADTAINGRLADPTGGAIAYHATSIRKPVDFGSVRPLCTIGKHIFYGEPK